MVFIVPDPYFGGRLALGESVVKNIDIEMSGTVFQCLVAFHDLLPGIAETDFDTLPSDHHMKLKFIALFHVIPVQRAEIHGGTQHIEHILFGNDHRVDLRP